MLVTFHSKDHYPIQMLGQPALELIHLMGMTAKGPGAIAADDVPQAYWQLQEALQALAGAAVAVDEDGQPQVTLAQRAVPLLAMLKAAIKTQHPIYWD